MVPLGLHGDDVHYARLWKVCIISWRSRLATSKRAHWFRNVFLFLPYVIIIQGVTVNQICSYFPMPGKPLLPDTNVLGWEIVVVGQTVCCDLIVAFLDMRGNMQFMVHAFNWKSYSSIFLLSRLQSFKSRVASQ